MKQNPGGEDGEGIGGEYPVTRWSNQWPKVNMCSLYTC